MLTFFFIHDKIYEMSVPDYAGQNRKTTYLCRQRNGGGMEIFMTKILFVCLGNICRSPMAEFVMKDFVQKKGLQQAFFIASAATSSEEAGNPVHYGTRHKLQQYGISTAGKYARKLTRQDYYDFDYLLGMEKRNLSDMLLITGGDPDGKIHRLLDFSGNPRDIADPWYTGNFDITYEDILEGCHTFFDFLIHENRIPANTQNNGAV